MTIALVLILAVGGLANAQVMWRSVASGNWGVITTWEYSTDWGSTWGVPPAAPATRDTSSDFIISTGHTVVVEASPKYCHNLTVKPDAFLTANLKQPTSDIKYIRIKGDVMEVDGVFGFAADPEDSADVLSLQVYGPDQALTIKGSGTINICRIRPHTGAGRTNITVEFETDVTITYIGSSGTGGAGIYSANDANNDNITFTVNPGRTLTMVDGCNLATSSSTSTDGTASTTFNINGTVNMLGGNLNLRGAAGKSIVLNVNGTLNVGGSVYPTGTTGVTSTINVGGTMNTGTLGKGTLYFDTPEQLVTGSGTFTVGQGATFRTGLPQGLPASGAQIQTGTASFSPGATYAYVGTSAQTTGALLPSHVRGLTIANAAGVTLSQSTLVDSTLTLTNGALSTGADTLAVGPEGEVARTSGYVDGYLAKPTPGGATTFEVGAAGGYSPVVVNVTAGSGGALVKAVGGIHPNVINGALALKRYWMLANTGITSADLTFGYPAGDVQGNETAYVGERNTTAKEWSKYTTTVDAVAHTATVTGAPVTSDWTLGEPRAFTPFDDPAALTVPNALRTITLDGKLDESEWVSSPTLLFGNGAYLKKGMGEQTVTGAFDIKATYDYYDQGVFYGTFHLPNTDSSLAKVKFLRKGVNLYIGIQSDDKSICKFDWEGDGMFLKIKRSNGTDLEYKLYYQNIGTAADTIRYEGPGGLTNFGDGAGYLMAGSTVNDTTNVDNGYTAELMIKLDSLGYNATLDTVLLSMAVFDPDGYQHPMNSYDTTAGSYFKSWWGSEWGGVWRPLLFTPEPVKFDDPPSIAVQNALRTMTVDGKLDESEWATAPTLAFGNGAFVKKAQGQKTVTGEFDIKATYDYYDQGVFYGTFHLPNTDSSLATVKFLRKGVNLFIGIQSNDESICKFDWEGDGLFLKIKRSNGTDLEYKLYYQNIGTAADTIRYEGPGGLTNYGEGAGYLMAGSTVNDTTNVDNGYTAELMIKLDSLGYNATLDTVLLSMAVFDPDGYQHPMNSYDTTAGSYFKSWWGSEWGGVWRSLTFSAEPVKFDDPDTVFAPTATGTITVDGVLDETDWTRRSTPLLFGNGAFLKKASGQNTVTGEFDIKATYDYYDQGTFYGTFHLPNTDSSLATVKFLRKGANLYIGIESNDESICKFDWEGDGMFLKIRRANGTDVEYKLYYQNVGTAADTIRYEPPAANYGLGAGKLASGSTANDTTNVDNGYTAELMIKLDSLGYLPTAKGVQLSMAVFDPDGYQHPMNSYDTTAGSYYKSWWGSEWGGVWRVVTFDDLVGVDDETGLIPQVYALHQNFPNPFNPSTRIRFDVPAASTVRIAVFDVTGREVASLVQGDYAPGTYTTTFDAGRLASGVYFYRMMAFGVEGGGAAFVTTNKLLLLK
jgi:hypothetical protein